MSSTDKVTYKFIKVDTSNLIWVAQISRPEALNALNQDVLQDLGNLTEAIEAAFPKTCRGLIITGEGEKSFVAGADIKQLNALSSAESVSGAFEFAQKGQKIFRKFEKASVPVVAAVNGFALGGGCELALSCDWIFASENAKFGLPEVSLGLIPGFGGTVRLSRVIGIQRARQLAMTGEMVSAARALEMGLVSKVVPQTQLLAECQASLKLVLERSPLAVARAKKSVLEAYDADLDQAMRIEALHFSDLFRSQDMKEGTSAFLEKRKPVFTGV